jgi:hypothetical protein
VIYSSKPSIDARWSLYCILVLQPLLTGLILALKTLFHSVPIGEGFGLVTILAGVNKETLHSIDGAALTGQLKKPIRMAIGVSDHLQDGSADKQRGPTKGLLQRVGRIEFVIDGRKRNGKLTKGSVYT